MNKRLAYALDDGVIYGENLDQELEQSKNGNWPDRDKLPKVSEEDEIYEKTDQKNSEDNL